MGKVNLPYGIDIFAKVRDNHCYYVDKTGFIRELLSESFDVNLITRPRRFGKTLIMSMLAEFFDVRKDSKRLFAGLEIADDTEICDAWMNRWPVLFLTFKDVQGRKFETAYALLEQTISKLCIEHAYLAESDKIDPADRETFGKLKSRKADITDMQCALDTLLRMMKNYYGKEVILLIDEYDVPLAKASDNRYYEDMLEVVRSLFGMVWKSNLNLKFAVVTGCLRIAKESIFTGANNFISNSISGENYQDYFGFTEEEVTDILNQAELPDALPEMKKWYDGYLFGTKEVFCPWDVINHVRALMINPTAEPGDYWIDTSHNNIIRSFIDHPKINVNEKFEILLSGGVIQESICENLTYDIAHSTEDNLWSILYLTGYLTRVSPHKLPAGMMPEEGKLALRIPNEEVKSVFSSTVKKWFEDKIASQDRTALFDAWWNGDAVMLTQEITDILFATISYFDFKEDYYHALITGMFLGAGYAVKSNAEAGMGRADIIIKEQRQRRALVIEIKWSKRKGNSLKRECEDALLQIEKEQYKKNLELEGYRHVLCYGAAFQGKTCLVQLA